MSARLLLVACLLAPLAGAGCASSGPPAAAGLPPDSAVAPMAPRGQDGGLPRARAAEVVYEEGPRSSDGTGRYYLGREIARVMSHRGAAWLERADREIEERPDLLVASLDLDPDDVVADIGAGTG